MSAPPLRGGGDKKYIKHYHNSLEVFIEVNFSKNTISYEPKDRIFSCEKADKDSKEKGIFPSLDNPSKGFVVHRSTTCNLSCNENFVTLVCVDFLLDKGYKPEHIILEPAFSKGHGVAPAYGDVLVLNQQFEPLVLIENKTYGGEFKKEWNIMQKNGGQLFTYFESLGSACEYVCLFACDIDSNTNNIIYDSYLITLQDNSKYLESLNKNLKKDKQKQGFKDAKNAREYYNVWKNTYGLAFSTKGIFEKDIQAYTVGKEKYTTKDLQIVNFDKIRSIYHDFATILRNHSITNFESVFYILVDLFLCKITDERHNKDDLKFYYKGVAYDNPLDYCDRLLNLYKQGREELFNVEVINVGKDEIDTIFTKAGRHKGLFKAEIENLFTQIKFFNIKKFNFISVENEEEFYINFSILIEITSLFQDIYLTQSENNQFLGDLFEGLLNRSIHQTEGQFFTPTPITNFIINSLSNLNADCKVLDFACGAGHFLTEYMQYTKKYNKNSTYKIYGIESNKDLSNVAKISSILHGSNIESKIIFQNALKEINTYQNEFIESSFDLILSNPPYSVKGFLENLESSEINKFDLAKFIDSKSYDKNNAIECFFIERAKYFLKEDGIFALVLPISILQKGGIYERSREILLAHFKILSIVELNKRTFGSTGTQTAIIFAQKIDKQIKNKDFIDSLKNKLFNDLDSSLNDEFIDTSLLREYCEFMDYDYEEYKNFLQDSNYFSHCKERSDRSNPQNMESKNLFNCEVFKNYLSDYKSNKPKVFKKQDINKTQQTDFFEKSTFLNNYKKQEQEINSTYSKDTKAAQKERKSKLKKLYNEFFNSFLVSKEYKDLESSYHFTNFINDIKALELEKLEYFSYIQNNELIIIKSPADKTSDNKSNKKEIVRFLGYDWSNRKGDEGIKYITQAPEDIALKESEEDSSDEKKDKETLRNINSIKFIKTPLYNPQDSNDKTKLNYAIKSFINLSLQDKTITSLRGAKRRSNPQTQTIATSHNDENVELKQALQNLLDSINPDSTSDYKIFTTQLLNLIDFSKVEFDKSINLNVSRHTERSEVSNPFAHCKYPLEPLQKILKSEGKGRRPASFANENGIYPFIKSSKTLEKCDEADFDFEAVIIGDGGMANIHYMNEKFSSSDHTYIFSNNKDNPVMLKFVYYVINSNLQILEAGFKGIGIKNISKTFIQNLKIPLPPLEIQEQIVKECEEVEKQYQTIRMTIEQYQKLIKAILVKCGIVENTDLSSGGG